MSKPLSSFFGLPGRSRLILLFFLFLCSLILSLPMIRSGLNYSYGLGFWGPNGHDGIWHLSLINHASNPFSIPLPSFSGQPLQNYHPFFDTLTAWLSRLTLLPPSLWLFQIMPFLMSFLFLFLSVEIILSLSGSLTAAFLIIFLNTFTNSFGWLVSLLRRTGLGGESMFWSAQSLSLQINPPYALSLVFLLLMILILVKSSGYRLSLSKSLAVFILLTLIPVTKAYAAVPAFGFLFFFALLSALKRRFQPLLLLIVSLISSIVVFSLYNTSSGSLVVFQPLWFVRSMIDSPDRLYLPRLSSFLNTLSSLNPYDIRVLLILAAIVVIFIVGNYSWRLLGFLVLLKRTSVHLRILALLIGIISLIPLIFVQKGTSWNTIQFLYYALILANFLLAAYLSGLKFSLSRNLLLTLIISSSLLASFPYFQNFLGNPSPASLPPSEITALKFLSRQPRGLVLTYPYDPYLKNGMSTPIPLYAYETTSYVSAFTPHYVYLADEMNLDITGYDWKSRRLESGRFFLQQSEFSDRGFLVNNQIDYIYLTGLQIDKVRLDTAKMSLQEIYNDGITLIYQVQR